MMLYILNAGDSVKMVTCFFSNNGDSFIILYADLMSYICYILTYERTMDMYIHPGDSDKVS